MEILEIAGALRDQVVKRLPPSWMTSERWPERALAVILACLLPSMLTAMVGSLGAASALGALGFVSLAVYCNYREDRWFSVDKGKGIRVFVVPLAALLVLGAAVSVATGHLLSFFLVGPVCVAGALLIVSPAWRRDRYRITRSVPGAGVACCSGFVLLSIHMWS
jgi:hypothetical protein